MKTLRVLCITLDTSNLIVYLDDGSTIIIPQGDPRVRNLLDFSQDDLINNGFCDIPEDLLKRTDIRVNAYKEVEKMSGIVKFFRIAKQKLTSIFESSASGISIIGNKDALEQKEKIAEVMAHAKELDQYPEPNSNDTVIAVTESAIIPEAHKLNDHINHVSSNPQRAKGFSKFLERLSASIVSGSHTLQDVLDFVSNNNMPIADDGSIIVFKRVYRCDSGSYVDCYSKSVRQDIGDIVRMDISIVDPNRYVDCSVGLHVASWSYLRDFRGDSLLICKLYPEHIVAVPHKDATKVRASEYTILGEITGDEYHNVLRYSDGILRTEKGKAILAEAIKGKLDPIAKSVVFIKSSGEVDYSEQANQKTTPKKAELSPTTVEASAKVVTSKKHEPVKDKPVNVREIANKVEGKPMTRQETMANHIALWDRTKSIHDLRKIQDYKRKTKVSWEKLGVDEATTKRLLRAIKNNLS